jgi:hypothetical protein
MTTGFDQLRAAITRDNALDLLREVACPECGGLGAYQLFDEPNNGGVGIQCLNCERRHPFMRLRIMFLSKGEHRLSNDIIAVMNACGFYCFCCGNTYEELRRLGVGMHVHHSRPRAEHGEAYAKIPLCAVCHELITLMQRTMRRFINHRRNPTSSWHTRHRSA